jgi:serine/threonine-protein kinase
VPSSPPFLADPAEGQVLAGKYRIVRRVGAGGMCTVFEAVHQALDQPVALKILKPELATDRDSVMRFEREARAAAQLRSPNVARVFDVDWLPEGQPYMTMELLVGHDLGTELARAGRLPVELAVDFVRQAAAGVSEAHALGIVHRDLKPENLFLTDLGSLTDRKLVKLLDFGIAKTVSDSARRLTAPDAVFGTVDYMSPEQIRSASTVDHRTDIWSLGVILYELLTGRTPFHGDARSVIAQIVSDPVKPPSVLVPALPTALVAVVMKALHKDREKRFQTAEELRDALAPFVELEPITTVIANLPPQSMPRRSVSAPPPQSARDHRTNLSFESVATRRGWGKPFALVAASFVLTMGAAALLVWMRNGHTFEGLGRSAAPPPPTLAEPPSTSHAPPPPPAPAPPPAVAVTSSDVAASAEPAPAATPAPPREKGSKRRPPPPRAGKADVPAAPPPEPMPSPSVTTPSLPRHL